ncbi:sensor histidine kinase [Aliikangiella sp. G2MR2-5]|uniref:sensor histidine kinase n=1 Tax=Aliikangiella sp. G2MR2-5 TaxID=2788943 RepID=UPI0018AB9602|nr:sensor histidine kinase [Aliikangiella sp. G2MR2-5]
MSTVLYLTSIFCLSAESLQITRLIYPKGLTQNSINDIFQDDEGIMWFATRGGIHYFNGEQFRKLELSTDSGPVTNVLYESIFQDSLGYLWFGGFEGEVYRYDKYTGNTLELGDTLKAAVNSDEYQGFGGQVYSFAEVDAGLLWIGSDEGIVGINLRGLVPFALDLSAQIAGIQGVTDIRYNDETVWLATSKGVVNFDRKTRRAYYLNLESESSKSIRYLQVTKLLSDEPFLWIGTASKGLYRYDINSHSVKHFGQNGKEKNLIAAGKINDIVLDDKNQIWIAQQTGGIHRYDYLTDHFYRYSKDKSNSFSLSSNDISSLLFDRSKLLWIGTSNSGINQLSRVTNKFRTLKSLVNNSNSLSDDFVWDITSDKNDNIWFATLNGLDKYEPLTGGFTSYQIQRSIENNNQIITLSWSANDTLWVGLANGELFEFYPETGNFSPVYHTEMDGRFSNARILHLYKDNLDYLWIATYEGTYRLSPQQQKQAATKAAHYVAFTSAIARRIYHDDKGRFWIGTNGQGLLAFDNKLELIASFTYKKNKPNSISSNVVRSIYQDSDNRLWLGTASGLNMLDSHDFLNVNENFLRVDIDNGVLNDMVYSIQPGKESDLWLSTNLGLVKYTSDNQQTTIFQVEDGISANEFNGDASIRTNSGDIYFGSVSGVTFFNPDNIEENTIVPSIIIRNIMLDGVSMSSAVSLKNFTHLEVNSELREIEIEFFSTDYHQPSKNRYRYRLLPVNHEWSELESGGQINFAHLSTGEYQLELMGSNNSGVWSNRPRQLLITVHPRWWQSRTAIILYLLTAIALAALYVRKQQAKLKREKEITDNLSRLNRLKDEFLANTSHEFRTPLNGIVGLSEYLINSSELSEEHKEIAGLIHFSGKRLADLVNDILDDASLNNGKLILEYEEFLLVPLVKSEIKTLSLNVKAEVELSMIVESEELKLNADPKRIKQIIHNLVGNAIKFTEQGKIEVTISCDEDWVVIEVADTGPGIPREKLTHIFDNFSQVDGSLRRKHGGIGLGLSITKKLVELHHGTISVDSELGVGSTFVVRLPKKHLGQSI